MVDFLKENFEDCEMIDNYYKHVAKLKFQVDKNCEIVFDFDKFGNKNDKNKIKANVN